MSKDAGQPLIDRKESDVIVPIAQNFTRRSKLEQLPDDVQINIFSFFEHKDIKAYRSLNHFCRAPNTHMLMPGPIHFKKELVKKVRVLGNSYAFSRREMPPIEGWQPNSIDFKEWDEEERAARTRLMYGDQLFIMKVKLYSIKSKRKLLLGMVAYFVLTYSGYAGMLYKASEGDSYMIGYSVPMGLFLLLMSYCCCCKFNLSSEIKLCNEIQAIHKELNDLKMPVREDKRLLMELEEDKTINPRP